MEEKKSVREERVAGRDGGKRRVWGKRGEERKKCVLTCYESGVGEEGKVLLTCYESGVRRNGMVLTWCELYWLRGEAGACSLREDRRRGC